MLTVMGIIFILSHQSGDQLEVPDLPFIDKFAHFAVFAVLAATVILVPSQEFKHSRPLTTVFIAVSFSFMYGVGDEFHQSFVPGRFVSAADLLADTIGALCVSLLWLKRRHRMTSSCSRYDAQN